MRTSAAALAIIKRVNPLETIEYLVQWNDDWQAYSLIGGHVEAGETFRQCCVREIIEELACQLDQFQLAEKPLLSLRFREFSQAAKQETDYEWQIFHAELGESVLQNLPVNCAWVTAIQIQKGFAYDGHPIAGQIQRVHKAIQEQELSCELITIVPDHQTNQEE